MRQRGFLENDLPTAADIIGHKKNDDFVTIDRSEPLSKAVTLFKEKEISQAPVTENGLIIGSISDKGVLNALIKNPRSLYEPVEQFISEPFPHVQLQDSTDKISALFSKENAAVLVEDRDGKMHIITEYDLIQSIATKP
jgi:cystathionine beta-synthase